MIYREMRSPVGGLLSEQKDVKMYPLVPMVYEHVPAEPLSWEYRILSIDLREQDMPTVEKLNELGGQGWLLVGALNTDQRRVNYYFVRQKQA
ncbi:MAG TPA: hypothetical protein VGT44_23855 [Ktedonobacteraceae bacterium]|nr:hypothetical protein [Ktedonobacteraceae bacterium]